MKTAGILGIFLSMMNQVKAVEVDTHSCDLLYARRAESSLLAQECYTQALQTAQHSTDQNKEIYQRIFIALSAAINDLPKTETERKAIERGLQSVENYRSAYGETAEYFYWKACFMSFQAIQDDRGSLIPLKMFSILGTLQEYLQTAIKMDSNIHFQGPRRVLGIMHTQMPGMVGGDKVLAEKMLREAYLKAPQFSMNHLAYAKILDINGKTNEAIKVLNSFLSKSNDAFNPHPEKPLLNLLPETKKDKEEASRLLNELTE